MLSRGHEFTNKAGAWVPMPEIVPIRSGRTLARSLPKPAGLWIEGFPPGHARIGDRPVFMGTTRDLAVLEGGAAGGTRTRTSLRNGDFKSPVSAISPRRRWHGRGETLHSPGTLEKPQSRPPLPPTLATHGTRRTARHEVRRVPSGPGGGCPPPRAAIRRPWARPPCGMPCPMRPPKATHEPLAGAPIAASGLRLPPPP